MDRLLDESEHILLNLVSYYYSPKPPSLAVALSRSNSSSSSNSPPPDSQQRQSQSKEKKYTLQEQQLCAKLASFTGMHESHIFDCYDQVKSSSIDSFTINEVQVQSIMRLDSVLITADHQQINKK